MDRHTHCTCKMSREELFGYHKHLFHSTRCVRRVLRAERSRSSALTSLPFQRHQQQSLIWFLMGKWASLKLCPWCRFIEAAKCHFLHPSAKRVWISKKEFFKNSAGFTLLQNSERACLRSNVHPSSQNIDSHFIIYRVQKLSDEKAIKEKRS